jgi:hypothetical protein
MQHVGKINHGGDMMYFSRLNSIQKYDQELLNKLDVILMKFHSSASYFTHRTISRALGISEEKSFDLLFEVRGSGVIGTIFVKKCTNCGKVYRNVSKPACVCNNNMFKSGYYFTTDLHKVN